MQVNNKISFKLKRKMFVIMWRIKFTQRLQTEVLYGDYERCVVP